MTAFRLQRCSSRHTSVKCPVTRVALNRPPLPPPQPDPLCFVVVSDSDSSVQKRLRPHSRRRRRMFSHARPKLELPMPNKSHALRVKMRPLILQLFSMTLPKKISPPAASKVTFFLRPYVHSGKRLYCLSFVYPCIVFSTTLKGVTFPFRYLTESFFPHSALEQ